MSFHVGNAIGKRIEAGSNRPLTSNLAKAEGTNHPERQKGLWSFLTWSFFLANFLTAAEINSGGARAAAADDGSGNSLPSGDEIPASTALPHDVMPAALETVPPGDPLQTTQTGDPMDLLAVGPSIDPSPYSINDVFGPVGRASASGSAGFGGSSGYSSAALLNSSTVNNFFSLDSHDISITNINNYLNIDSHDVTNVINIETVVNTNPNVVTTTAAGVADLVSEASPIVLDAVADVGDVVGSLTSTVDGLVTTVLDETVTNIVDEVGDTATVLLESVEGTLDAALNVTETAVADVGDVAGGLTSTIDGLVTTALDETVTIVAEVGDTATGLLDGVTGTVDTALAATEMLVADAGDVAGDLTSTIDGLVTTVLDETVTTAADAIPSTSSVVTDVLEASLSTTTDLVDEASPITALLESVTDTLEPTVTAVLDSADGGLDGPSALDVASVILHADTTDSVTLGGITVIVSAAVDVTADPLSEPVVAVDAGSDGGAGFSDGADNGALASISSTSSADAVNDAVEPVMSEIGIGSSGSLSFADESLNLNASQDSTAAAGYSQYNLAVQDASTQTEVSEPVSVDTGGITTIIASALGVGQQSTTTDANSSDNSSDQQVLNTPLLDDVHSALHSGLLG